MTRRIPRFLARAPIPLFRVGLGALLGRRLLMLQHRGRVTGMPRYVVLEVVDREPDELILVSGYGTASEWYRNILAETTVRVWTGRLRAATAQATPIRPDEAVFRLERYRNRNPRAATALGRALGIPELTNNQPLPHDVCRRLPLVQVRVLPGLSAPTHRVAGN